MTQDALAGQGGSPRRRGELTRKYALFVGLAICLALGLNAAIATFFAFSDQRALLVLSTRTWECLLLQGSLPQPDRNGWKYILFLGQHNCTHLTRY